MAAPPANDIQIFDRALWRQRRARAANNFAHYDFLVERVTSEMGERLLDLNRPFHRVIDLSAHQGHLLKTLKEDHRFRDHPIGTELFIQSDSCEIFSRANQELAPAIVADEEWLPFKENAADLIISSLTFQHANDLPGIFSQIRRTLAPDGMLLCAFFGGETLSQLRQIFLEVETELLGGASPHISPFADIRDIGALLQRTGFTLPVVDRDTFEVDYSTVFDLFKDLRGMGQTNILVERPRRPTRRDTLFEVAERYHKKHRDPQGRISASFEILYATGWSPHESQQQPLKPGEGKMPLGDAIKRASGQKAD